MKMKKIFSPLLFLLAISCKKSANETPGEALYGRAVYTSPVLLTTDTVVLANRHISVKDSATGTLYDLVTDTAGKFFLPAWSKLKAYRIDLKWEQNTANEYRVVYFASTTARGDSLKNFVVVAKPDTVHYQSLLLSAKDIFGGKVPGAKIFIYTSRSIASLDTAFVGTGVLTSLTTNNIGGCLAMQLPPDSLFIKSQFILNDSVKLRSNILAIKPGHQFTDTSIVIHQ